MLHAGHMPSTSQLNPYQYLDFFDALARQGDVLHVAFGSGMTASVKNAWEAAEEIRRKYPNRRIEVVDSLCSSSGYGLLVDYAADLRDADRNLEETLAWLQENCRSRASSVLFHGSEGLPARRLPWAPFSIFARSCA